MMARPPGVESFARNFLFTLSKNGRLADAVPPGWRAGSGTALADGLDTGSFEAEGPSGGGGGGDDDDDTGPVHPPITIAMETIATIGVKLRRTVSRARVTPPRFFCAPTLDRYETSTQSYATGAGRSGRNWTLGLRDDNHRQNGVGSPEPSGDTLHDSAGSAETGATLTGSLVKSASELGPWFS